MKQRLLVRAQDPLTTPYVNDIIPNSSFSLSLSLSRTFVTHSLDAPSAPHAVMLSFRLTMSITWKTLNVALSSLSVRQPVQHSTFLSRMRYCHDSLSLSLSLSLSVSLSLSLTITLLYSLPTHDMRFS